MRAWNRFLTGQMSTEDDPENSLDGLQAAVAESGQHERIVETYRTMDTTDILGRVQCPTLVIARRDGGFGDPGPLAAGIPGAQLTYIPGTAAFPYIDEAQPSFDAVNSFLRQSAAQRGEPADQLADVVGAFRTILFTDVVASTPLLAQLKDAKMREVMRDHDAVLDAAVSEHGGRVVKEIGDAFMVEFAIPSAAVECAIAMQRGIQAQFADSDIPIRLRIGINAGEPVAEDGDLHGASVNIAKRLESAAATNGILISDVVKQAVVGKDFEFADQGEVALKGFDDPVHAWSVEWD